MNIKDYYKNRMQNFREREEIEEILQMFSSPGGFPQPSGEQIEDIMQAAQWERTTSPPIAVGEGTYIRVKSIQLVDPQETSKRVSEENELLGEEISKLQLLNKRLEQEVSQSRQMFEAMGVKVAKVIWGLTAIFSSLVFYAILQILLLRVR